MSFPRYREYKDSKVEWLGEIPSHWTIATTKRLARADIKNGVGEAGAHENRDWPRYLRITDIAGPRKLKSDSFKSLPPDVAAEAPVAMGDLLVAAVGATYGKSYLHEIDIGPCCYAGYLIRFSPSEALDSGFAAYWTESQHYWGQVQSRVVQSTVQNFSAGKFRELSIAFPPKNEQAQIAAFLDRETAKIDALIAEQEKLLALLAEKRRATISQAVTRGLNPDVPLKDSDIPWIGQLPAHWDVAPIKSFGWLKGGSGFPHEDQGKQDEELGFYKVGALGSADLDGCLLPASDTISRETATRLGAWVFPAHTIVFAKVGAALMLGRICELTAESCIDNNMMGIVVGERQHVGFLKRAMSLVKFDLIANPGAVPSLNAEQIGNYQLPKPPFEEQAAIASFLDANANRFNGIREEINSALSLLRERRSALITAAVTGQIDVRGFGREQVAA